MYSRQNLHNIEKGEGFTESTGVVSDKYPSKVKLENFFHNFRMLELR